MCSIFRISDIKIEPEPEKPKWTLIAVSEAARKWRSRFVLQPNQTYTVGRKRMNAIQLPSGLCSKTHCELLISENEVIMKDKVSIFYLLYSQLSIEEDKT